MATQILNTEVAICRKNLHHAQRELYWGRFVASEDFSGNEKLIAFLFKRVKQWRLRYNAAMAIEQSREESIPLMDAIALHVEFPNSY